MATYYVATNGSNSNPGSFGSPKLTVHGATGGLSLLSTGDTLYIRVGTYNEFINTNSDPFPVGTSFSNAPFIGAFPGEVVTFTGSWNIANSALNPAIKYVILDGFRIDGINFSAHTSAISLFGSGTVPFADMFIRVQNVEIVNFGGPFTANQGDCSHGVECHASANEFLNMVVHNATAACGDSHGFYINGRNNLISGCQMYSCTGYGIQSYNDTAGADTNIIRNCQVHDNGSARTSRGGIALYQGTNSAAYNNLIWGNVGSGIVIGGTPSIGMKVWNNTVDNSNGSISIQPGANTPVIQNNIIYPNAIQDLGSVSPTIDHNLATNPSYINGPAHDYHLQTGSVARDTGTTIATVTTDFDGTGRPQNLIYDIGAYEYIVSVPPPAGVAPVFETFTGTGALDSNWAQAVTVAGAELVRNTDQASTNSTGKDCWAYYIGANFDASQYSQCTIAAGVAQAGTHYCQLFVRASGSSTTFQGYAVFTNGSAGSPLTYFAKIIGNSQTILTGISTAPTVGQRIRLTISSDNKLKFWIDGGQGWTEVQTYDLGSVPEIVSGAPGLGAFDGTGINVRLDTWEGGNYTSGRNLPLLGIGS